MPSDAPAMTAHGPYFCANSVISRPFAAAAARSPPVSVLAVRDTRSLIRQPSGVRTKIVVVMPQGVNPIGGVVGLQHQHGVDVGARRGAVPVDVR